MKVSGLLRRARDVISSPKSWTQGSYARTSQGQEVDVDDLGATCFCSLGAICKASVFYSAGDVPVLLCEAKNALSGAMGGGISKFNDAHTHEEVMAAWDQAINSFQEINK